VALDREKFLAFALALSACHGGHHAGTAEGFERSAYDDPSCTGFSWQESGEQCVAWRSGKVKAGFVPTAECARWDDAGRCTANVFVPR
jgi:hypothetical protein